MPSSLAVAAPLAGAPVDAPHGTPGFTAPAA